jgi:ABC-type polysaccharide/polyol phosphate transport system ATPase subunit
MFISGSDKMAKPIIELRDVSVDYPIILTGSQQSLLASVAHTMTAGRLAHSAGSIQLVRGLSKLNLRIKPGERVGLVGRNGAGKSTLLKVLAGILPATAGRAHIKGSTANVLTLGSGMDGDLTGYENIERMLRLMSVPKSEVAAIKHDVEEFTELGKFLALPVRTYSAGMHVRLGFAMATVVPSEILILDEIIGAGDMFFTDKAYERIKSYSDTAQIMVMATHSAGALERFCNRAILLEGGSIIKDGSPTEVWEEYERRDNTGH